MMSAAPRGTRSRARPPRDERRPPLPVRARLPGGWPHGARARGRRLPAHAPAARADLSRRRPRAAPGIDRDRRCRAARAQRDPGGAKGAGPCRAATGTAHSETSAGPRTSGRSHRASCAPAAGPSKASRADRDAARAAAGRAHRLGALGGRARRRVGRRPATRALRPAAGAVLHPARMDHSRAARRHGRRRRGRGPVRLRVVAPARLPPRLERAGRRWGRDGLRRAVGRPHALRAVRLRLGLPRDGRRDAGERLDGAASALAGRRRLRPHRRVRDAAARRPGRRPAPGPVRLPARARPRARGGDAQAALGRAGAARRGRDPGRVLCLRAAPPAARGRSARDGLPGPVGHRAGAAGPPGVR